MKFNCSCMWDVKFTVNFSASLTSTTVLWHLHFWSWLSSKLNWNYLRKHAIFFAFPPFIFFLWNSCMLIAKSMTEQGQASFILVHKLSDNRMKLECFLCFYDIRSHPITWEYSLPLMIGSWFYSHNSLAASM